MTNILEGSLNSFAWQMKSVDDVAVAAIVLNEGIPEIVARVMVARGITVEEAHSFLYGSLKENFPNPSLLKDCDEAAHIIGDLIKENAQIGIFGDYDVDGLTSSALLYLFLKELGQEPIIYIPEREEGYGPSKSAITEILDKGAKAIITVDCGTSSPEVLNPLQSSGIQVVIIDHHEPNLAKNPQVSAYINPKRFDEEPKNQFRNMAAAGVAFMFVVALNRYLRNSGFYQERKMSEVNITKWLDMVALGTVCDVMALRGVNRLLVKSGLKVLAGRSHYGLKYLIDKSNISEKPNVYHMGYILGPRINAGGRLGSARLSSQLLCTDDEMKANDLAGRLCEMNSERQQIEADVLMQAIEQVETFMSSSGDNQSITFAYGNDWHSGVIGIVAGRLKERYFLPSFVITVMGDEAHGSCRGTEGVDVGAVIMDALALGILTNGGGHQKAAGFSLVSQNIEKAREFFGEKIAAQNSINQSGNPVIEIDAMVDFAALNMELAQSLSLLEPFGEGNQAPLFMVRRVSLFFLSIRGGGHIACTISGMAGGSVKAIVFKAVDTPLGQVIMKARGELFNIVGKLQINEWQGRKTVQFNIVDAALA